MLREGFRTSLKNPYPFECNPDKSVETTMTNRTITHEIKLQKSVIIILALLTIGVCANVFAPAFTIQDAEAKHVSWDNILGTKSHPLFVHIKNR